MLFTEEHVRNNLRNRDGKRVFYLGQGDTLTPSARGFLQGERIEILPAEQAKPAVYKLEKVGFLQEKPEHMTCLYGDVLVAKNHPRIIFRGMVDMLEAELLLGIWELDTDVQKPLEELLTLARKLIRWDVLNEPAEAEKLYGMTPEELREKSHFPQKYFGKPHFMPEATDGATLLRLNRLRALTRQTEIAAVAAFGDTRTDIIRALNRMSSLLYILMVEKK